MPGKDELLLLHRYLSGTMEVPEQQEFEQRLTQDPELARLKNEFADIWAASVHVSIPQFDSQKAFETFQRNTQSTRIRRRLWIASAAAVICILVVGGLSLLRERIPVQDIHATVLVEQTLDDGSRLQMRPGASMRIPESFSGRTRKVELVRGEVYFVIASDAAHPFVITHDWAQVKVVGTEFVISIDTTEHTFALNVTEGEVIFTPQLSNEAIPVRAGTGLIFDADTRVIIPVRDLDANVISWHTGVLTFMDTPVKKVVDDLMHHYGIHIELANQSIEECRFTAPLPYRDVPVKVILDALSTTFGMTLEETSKTHYILSNGKCLGEGMKE